MRGAALSMAAAAIGFVLLLPVSVIQGQNGWGVTYSPTYICAIKGSTVEIGCTYTHPYTVTQVQERFWFTKESNGFHVDLRTEPEYSGRVQYYFGENACTLTITDLRESDSAEYKFRFTTNRPGGKYTGSPGVTLFVADLQVQVMRSEVSRMSRNSAQFMCHSSCYLPADQAYIWYKNGQNIQETTSSHFYLDNFNPADSYSCAVRGHEDVPSPSVSGHWGVAYPYTQICAFKGSTVEIHCTYRYPSTMNGQHTQVKKQFWFTNLSDNEPVDLTNDPKYSGRVKYHCTENDCTLTISHLSESDSAEYKFRFTTNHQDGKYIGHPGVTLSVTDPQLQVNVRRLTVNWDSPWTELECHICCRPLHDLSYIWYKNDQEVKGENSFYFVPFGSAEKYRCAIRGREHFRSPPVYAPKLPSVSVSPSGEIVEGSSVTLTCSSDANPAAKYTWYKENEDSPKASGQIFTITDFRPEHSGNYYCEAQNTRGRRNSTLNLTVVAGAWKSTAIRTTTAVVAVVLAVILLTVFILMRKKWPSQRPSEPGERPDNREQDQQEQQDDLYYASVKFSPNQVDPLYSNIRADRTGRQREEEEEAVEYTVVKFNSGSASSRPRGEETVDVLYSTINKTC